MVNIEFLGPLPNEKYVFAKLVSGQYVHPRKKISNNGSPFKSKEINNCFSKDAIIYHWYMQVHIDRRTKANLILVP